jgi:Zn-dependent peptidase ImmA (M78 family)/DNA-binding XRE family transcriptional regulator
MDNTMFNQRLQRARKAVGLSLRDLGEAVGLSHAAIKKYEDGTALPTSEVLIKLARALNVRSEYFFRPENIVLEGVEYRKRSSLPQKRLDAITHEILDQIERRLELESLFPSPPVKEFSIPDGLLPKVDHIDRIEDLANQLRDTWDLGLDPILDLIDLLETQGIRVFMINAEGDSKFDGLAAHVGNMPIVVVGRSWPGDRQRFTLAHELGHLLLEGRLAEDLNEEKACDRFAGAFLFPKQSVIQELGIHRNAIEIKELSLLKEEFGLSMAGILYRALDLGIISKTYRDNQNKFFSIKGWNRKEPGLMYPSEKAHVFEQLTFHALAEEYIGESKAAELLNLPLNQFRKLRLMESEVAMDAVTYQ